MRLTERFNDAVATRFGRSDTADVGVVFIDLDGFKTINDSFGHAAGDEVLLLTASRLLAHVRRQDTVARLGGDEFMPRALANDRTGAVIAQESLPTLRYDVGGHAAGHLASASAPCLAAAMPAILLGHIRQGPRRW